MDAEIDELDPPQIDRLWKYRNMLATGFYNESSLFLLAESMLFVAFATLRLVAGRSSLWYSLTLCLFGISLTIIWWLVNTAYMRLYYAVRHVVDNACPEYAFVRSTARTRVNPWVLVTHWTPSIVIAGWIALLCITLLV